MVTYSVFNGFTGDELKPMQIVYKIMEPRNAVDSDGGGSLPPLSFETKDPCRKTTTTHM